MDAYLILIIAIALLFDYSNGFHDAANTIATVVSTRVLSPRAAVVWAASFNFLAFLVYPHNVTAAIAHGIELTSVTHNVILATLIGAITWNAITWWWGLPSSSSHALMGAFAGAALANTPRLSILNAAVFGKVVIFIVVAPMLGMVLGGLLMYLVRFIFARRRPAQVDRFFRRGQLISAGLYSLGHGGNDAQKTMGIVTLLLITSGIQERTEAAEPRFWVVIVCQAAMALGMLSGGWRIVRTMGMKITKLRPVGGFCAETAGAITLAMSTLLGVPVSTTHTITGSIVGVGAVERRLSAVRWGVAGRIVWAWVFTIPAAALIAVVVYYPIRLLSGSP
ncbi:MAG: inorganic phosphate transporter [Sorangiineae bacterium]|nr:inorganic phosphate transporter [Polyangiaceae bacterium]MEB2321183.1 inorganic phosphate transporter [Sorangiineae bacterium]